MGRFKIKQGDGNFKKVAWKDEVDAVKTYVDEKIKTDVPANAEFTDTVTPIVDNLTSVDVDKALSAQQGKVLKDELAEHKEDYLQQRQQDQLKVATVEKGLNDYKSTLANINPNQEAKQKVTGYGTISLPKNTANGQVSVSLKGNTITDETGTKSTVCASRVFSVNRKALDYPIAKAEYMQNEMFFNEVGVGRGSANNKWIDRKLVINNASSSHLGKGFTLKVEVGKTYTFKCKGEPNSSGNTPRVTLCKDTINVSTYYHWGTTVNGEVSLTFVATTSVLAIAFMTARGIGAKIWDIHLEEGATVTQIESYKETTQYITAKDEQGKIVELRSSPSAKDEVRVIQNKAEHIQRVGVKLNVASGTVINYADMPTGGQFVARASDGTNQTGVKGDSLTITAVTLTYQLAEPIITPINVSGNLISYPSGTIYVENVVADAGIYTTKFDIKELQLPIKSIDKLIKYNFTTGVQTVLDTSLAVINEDKKSFTHPNLAKDDMVFVDYFYDVEGTLGETTVEYYDSRHTIKDTTNDKFYSWDIKSTNGVPTVALTEVL